MYNFLMIIALLSIILRLSMLFYFVQENKKIPSKENFVYILHAFALSLIYFLNKPYYLDKSDLIDYQMIIFLMLISLFLVIINTLKIKNDYKDLFSYLSIVFYSMMIVLVNYIPNTLLNT